MAGWPARPSARPSAKPLSKRSRRHGLLLLGLGTLAAVVWFAGEPATARDRLSLLTAWLCFALLGAALSIGPWQALRTGQPVLNQLLRRDLGIWAALTGLAHLVVATGVVMQAAYFRAYITGPPDSPLPGWAGWIGTLSIVAGYVVGLMFLMLLTLSNQWSLARLGPARWKRLQGAAVVALFLTIAHGVVFQVIEGRTGLWLAALVVVSAAILGLRGRARRVVARGNR